MDVEDRLAGLGSGVDHHSVAPFGYSLLLSKLLGHEEEFPHQLPVLVFQFADRTDVLSWDDEDMSRGLGMDITEGQDVRSGADQLGWDLPFGDPAKETIGTGQRNLLPIWNGHGIHRS